jgi:hypothetical protein
MARRLVVVVAVMFLGLTGLCLSASGVPLFGQGKDIFLQGAQPGAAVQIAEPARLVEREDVARVKAELAGLRNRLEELTKVLERLEEKQRLGDRAGRKPPPAPAAGVTEAREAAGSSRVAVRVADGRDQRNRNLLARKIAVNLTDGSGYANCTYLGDKRFGGKDFAAFLHEGKIFAIAADRILSITAAAD